MNIPIFKGFLQPREPGGTPRLTEEQAAFLTEAMQIVMDWIPADTLSKCSSVQQMIDAMPRDRSCATCHHEDDRYCWNWRDDIPDQHAFEEGCSHHQALGLPDDIPF